MSTTNNTSARQNGPPGFSKEQGANWEEYKNYRPTYPPSFFEKILAYHSSKTTSAFAVAHDVGAGSGATSAGFAHRFESVVVSDPNDGYAIQARQHLIEGLALPSSKFIFLQEGAELTSLDSSSVDLVTACECIQWTDASAAIREFSRQLKAGGTLAITFYTVPCIVDNDMAQKAWKRIWSAYSERAQGELYDNAFKIINAGLETLCLPEEDWTAVQRVYINSQGSTDVFRIDDRAGESQTKTSETKIWIEDDEDWSNVRDLPWFKKYLSTWVPRLPELAVQDLWEDFELSMASKELKTQTPLVMILATKI